MLRKLRLNDPGFNGDIFESLLLPFFADVFGDHRKPGERNWRQIDPVLRDVFLAVITVYSVCLVLRDVSQGKGVSAGRD